MALVKDVRRVARDGKDYYTFRLVVGIDGKAVESIGWKYYPRTKLVRPPAVKQGPVWIALVAGIDRGTQAAIREAVESAIGGSAAVPEAGNVPARDWDLAVWMREAQELCQNCRVPWEPFREIIRGYMSDKKQYREV